MLPESLNFGSGRYVSAEKYRNEKAVQLLGPSGYILIQKVKISFSENGKFNSLLLNNYFNLILVSKNAVPSRVH